MYQSRNLSRARLLSLVLLVSVLPVNIWSEEPNVSAVSCQEAIRSYMDRSASEEEFMAQLQKCNSNEIDWVETEVFDGVVAGDSGADGILPVAAYRGHSKLIQYLFKVTSQEHLHGKLAYSKVIRGLSRITGKWANTQADLLKFSLSKGGVIETNSVFSAAKECNVELLQSAKAKGFLKLNQREKAQLLDLVEDSIAQSQNPDAKAACSPGYEGALKCYNATRCKQAKNFIK